MAQYRKGSLIEAIDKDDFNYEKVNIYLSEDGHILDYKLNPFHQFFYQQDKEFQKDIIGVLKNNVNKVPNIDEKSKEATRQLNDILSSLFRNPIPKHYSNFKIIYEVMKDENHHLYGKELITGIVFPISNFEYQYSYSISKIKLHTWDDRVFKLGWNGVMDSEGVEHGNKRLYDDVFLIYDLDGDYCYNEVKTNVSCISYSRKLHPYHQNIEKQGIFISEDGLATEYDIESYEKRFFEGLFDDYKLKIWVSILLRKVKKNTFMHEFNLIDSEEIKKIDLLDQNVSYKKIEESEPKGLVEQDIYSKHMDAIEYLLLKLKKVDGELYVKYKEEYSNLLKNSKNSMMQPITIEILTSLEANIEFILRFGNLIGENVLVGLEEIKQEYLGSVLNGHDEITSLSIQDLDRISELFLNMKNKYDLVDRRKILKDIAFLYFMVIYKNKDAITIEKLDHSYFKNNLKTVMINIEAMIELGIIDGSVDINLDDEPTLDGVFFIIQNISFVKTDEDVKKLVRELN